MKTNDFLASLTAMRGDIAAREEIARAKYANATDVSKDEKRALYLAHKELDTKLRYVDKLSHEKIVTKCASFVKDEEMLRQIIRDSYMIEKFTMICAAIGSGVKSFGDDYALEQALPVFVASDFKPMKHDDLRKQLMQKKNPSQCHETDRQASMICNLFERLNAAKRTKIDDRKATEFDSGHAVIKALNKLYA